MAVLDDIVLRTQDRLEEPRGLPGGFWNFAYELRPLVAEAMCEATLISGDPEVRSGAVTLIKNSNTQVMPSGALAITRLEGQTGIIPKEFLYNLDRMVPTWEQEEDAVIPKRWFPLGLNLWGIYPRLADDVQVMVNYIALPVADLGIFTGTEYVPFQNEYHDAIADLGAHVARLKDGGQEFLQSIPEYDRFIFKMKELARFVARKGIDRFALSVGAVSKVSDVETR